jgi:hypothetical protein
VSVSPNNRINSDCAKLVTLTVEQQLSVLQPPFGFGLGIIHEAGVKARGPAVGVEVSGAARGQKIDRRFHPKVFQGGSC